MHSMQAGYLEKAQKYTDKALMQLEKLKSKWINMHMWYLQHKIGEVCVFICVYLFYFSVGLQPDPFYLSSYSAGAYYHV